MSLFCQFYRYCVKPWCGWHSQLVLSLFSRFSRSFLNIRAQFWKAKSEMILLRNAKSPIEFKLWFVFSLDFTKKAELAFVEKRILGNLDLFKHVKKFGNKNISNHPFMSKTFQITGHLLDEDWHEVWFAPFQMATQLSSHFVKKQSFI